MLSERGHQELVLTSGELARVNKVLKWAQKHDVCTFYGMLASILRLMEFVYVPAAHVSVKLTEEVTRVLVNLGPLDANTWGATPERTRPK
jgi:hypothetical protein